MDKQQIILKAEFAIESLRPFLHADGGDIVIVDLTDDLVLQIQPIGSCKDCPFIDQTIKSSIIDTIKREVIEIKEIEILYK